MQISAKIEQRRRSPVSTPELRGKVEHAASLFLRILIEEGSTIESALSEAEVLTLRIGGQEFNCRICLWTKVALGASSAQTEFLYSFFGFVS